MKIKLTKALIHDTAGLMEKFVFAGVKEDIIKNMKTLCQTVDLYRDLAAKGNRYTDPNDKGKISVNIADSYLPTFTKLVSSLGFQAVKEYEMTIEIIGELCDIYKQLSNTGEEEKGEEILKSEEDIQDHVENNSSEETISEVSDVAVAGSSEEASEKVSEKVSEEVLDEKEEFNESDGADDEPDNFEEEFDDDEFGEEEFDSDDSDPEIDDLLSELGL